MKLSKSQIAVMESLNMYGYRKFLTKSQLRTARSLEKLGLVLVENVAGLTEKGRKKLDEIS